MFKMIFNAILVGISIFIGVVISSNLLLVLGQNINDGTFTGCVFLLLLLITLGNIFSYFNGRLSDRKPSELLTSWITHFIILNGIILAGVYALIKFIGG